MQQERLQKVLSAAGVASRREAETLISTGKVIVNGKVVTERGCRVDPERDHISVNGRALPQHVGHVYLVFYKPKGYVTTRRDPHATNTVMDLIIPALEERLGRRNPAIGGVHPVGRLDAQSEGLLLLTNDGELTQALTHPSHGVPKLYRAEVEGVPSEDAMRRLRTGIPLFGRRTAPARARITRADRTRDTAVVEVELREGRNQQVRRMLQAVGYPVIRLMRVAVGAVHLNRLKPGEWRFLTPAEVATLQSRAASAWERDEPHPPRPAGRAGPGRPPFTRPGPAGPPRVFPRAAHGNPQGWSERPPQRGPRPDPAADNRGYRGAAPRPHAPPDNADRRPGAPYTGDRRPDQTPDDRGYRGSAPRDHGPSGNADRRPAAPRTGDHIPRRATDDRGYRGSAPRDHAPSGYGDRRPAAPRTGDRTPDRGADDRGYRGSPPHAGGRQGSAAQGSVGRGSGNIRPAPPTHGNPERRPATPYGRPAQGRGETRPVAPRTGDRRPGPPGAVDFGGSGARGIRGPRTSNRPAGGGK